MEPSEFSVGDVVVSRYGSKPIRITFIPQDFYNTYKKQSRRYYHTWNSIRGVYLHSGTTAYLKYPQNYKKIESEENKMAQKTLYSYIDESGKTVIGTHIGTNSKNHFILEVKGRDDYVIKNPKELEEVLPYTFSVDFGGKELHYEGNPEKIQKGDWLILDTGRGNSSVVCVKSVDTKSRSATKFKGRKLLTEDI